MKTLVTVLFALIITASAWSLDINQHQLKALYAEETPGDRNQLLLDTLVSDLMPQITTVLPDSLKKQVIKQALNAWRGIYIPIIQINNCERSLINNVSQLRDVMGIINEVRALWPATKYLIHETVVEMYFNQLYFNDPQKLNDAFHQKNYECALRETMATDASNKTVYRPCAVITIKE